MDKKYQIFISSTYKDLIPEREKVRDVILSMYQFPIGMEMFSAADEEQWEIIKETIDSSDYYVLIIGKRYGTMIDDGPDVGISYTEKEFRYARSIGVPVLVYIKNENAITADKADEDPEKLSKLKLFIEEATKGREVKWFSTIDQLGTEVLLSLRKEMDRKKRPGWIRSDAVDIEKSLSEIVELSRQNRELQEDNKRLREELAKKAVVRKPLLTIDIQTTPVEKDESDPELYSHDDLMRVDENGTVHLKLKPVSITVQEVEYRKISKSDFPMEFKRHVSDREIEEYNQALPSKEELKKYLDAYEIYLRLKNTGIASTFFVNNIGNAKATDVSVTIEFPDEVRVFDIDEIRRIDEPKAPKKPDDLIQKAHARAHASEVALEKAMSQMDLFSGFSGRGRLADLMPEISSLNNTVFESIEIEDNIVEIEQKRGILHTKFDYFPGAYIVPKSTGEFEAKVTLMCAEYEEPEETIIKFIVEE